MIINSGASGNNFAELGIAPKLIEILEKNKFTKPTPIQTQSIPLAINGKDLMGIAQTGTGKTLAFGVPMIQRLAQSQGKDKGLVVLPTRELALQVDETLKKVGSGLGLRTAVLIGGESMHKQLRMLRQNPHIIISTPGRLIDHMERSRLSLNNVAILVLDEADRMLDMGFAPQIKKIMEKVPKHRQTMLFSATMPNEIVKIAQSYLTSPLRVEVAPAGSAVKTVSQELFFVNKHEKLSLLKNVLTQYNGSVLVFSRTKHGARKISRDIKAMGHSAVEIHSNRTLGQRVEALNGFKIGKYRILVATDIAARGIDVNGIQLVINYDLPANAEDYVHRIGRTGRAGMTGHAITFATPDQARDVRGIERIIRKTLTVSKIPTLTPFVREKEEFVERPQRAFRKHGHGKPNFRNSNNKHFGKHKFNGQNKNRSKNRRRSEPEYRKPSRPIDGDKPGYFLKRYDENR